MEIEHTHTMESILGPAFHRVPAGPWWLSETATESPENPEKAAEIEPEPLDGDHYDREAKERQKRKPNSVPENLPEQKHTDARDAVGRTVGVPMFPDEQEAYSESCWRELCQSDLDYLTGPRNYPAPCPWCGGRLHHSEACRELRASWEPSIPFGKHKGKPLSQVPHDYLEWLATAEVDSDLRQAVRIQLERVRP